MKTNKLNVIGNSVFDSGIRQLYIIVQILVGTVHVVANDWSIGIIRRVCYLRITPKRCLVSHFLGTALLGIGFLVFLFVLSNKNQVMCNN